MGNPTKMTNLPPFVTSNLSSDKATKEAVVISRAELSRSTPPPPSLLKGTGMNHSTFQSHPAAKTIYFIRHAQALHNVASDFSIPDPRLTALGIRQAQRIRDTIPADALANLELIVTSPMHRTVQTTLIAFRTQIEWQRLPVVLKPELQETHAEPCDTGSPAHQLIEAFPQLEHELKALPPNWYSKTGINAPTDDAWKSRAEMMRKWLIDRPERVIVVMCHNGFLRHLVGDELWSSHGRTPLGFSNGEARRYQLSIADGSLSAGGISVNQGNAVMAEVERVGYLP
eukprot:Partr_v1_DN27801_c0_g1_i2_m22664 putative phosphoglycerate mutase